MSEVEIVERHTHRTGQLTVEMVYKGGVLDFATVKIDRGEQFSREHDGNGSIGLTPQDVRNLAGILSEYKPEPRL